MLIVLLSFSRSLATKCMSINKEPCTIRPTVINLNPVELKYDPFMINLDKCSGVVILLMNYLQKEAFQ